MCSLKLCGGARKSPLKGFVNLNDTIFHSSAKIESTSQASGSDSESLETQVKSW